MSPATFRRINKWYERTRLIKHEILKKKLLILDCKSAVTTYTEEESAHIELNPLIRSACNDAISKYCHEDDGSYDLRTVNYKTLFHFSS